MKAKATEVAREAFEAIFTYTLAPEIIHATRITLFYLNELKNHSDTMQSR